MAFDYAMLTNVRPIYAVSSSIYTNPSSTTSYIRTIFFHVVTSSMQTISLWNLASGTTVSSSNKIFQYTLSGSNSFMLELGIPGIILTNESASIWATTTDNNGTNVMIMGGKE